MSGGQREILVMLSLRYAQHMYMSDVCSGQTTRGGGWEVGCLEGRGGGGRKSFGSITSVLEHQTRKGVSSEVAIKTAAVYTGFQRPHHHPKRLMIRLNKI